MTYERSQQAPVCSLGLGTRSLPEGRTMRRLLGDLSRHLVLALVLVGLGVAAIPASSLVAATVVTFPDANLEAAVRDALGQPTGDIYDDNLTSLITLDASGLGIVDLTGLEYCTNLKGLDLYGNQISDISPLSGLTGLTSLDLNSNQADNLTPLSGLVSLSYLDVGYNGVRDISPLSGLTGLTMVDLRYNQIVDLAPLSGLTGLTFLELDSNQTDNLTPLSGLTNLTQLDLGNNQVGDISPLAGLTSLTSLDLWQNQVSDLSALVGLTSLTHLAVWENQISDLSPLSGLTGLASLHLSWNETDNLTPLSGLTSLTVLDLGYNRVVNLSPLSGLTSLTSLTLGSNQIDNLTPLSGLTGLTYLELGYNQTISDISPLSGLTNLTYLYLGNNHISNLTPLSGLTSLTYLDLKSNQISDLIPVSGLTSLTYLYLSGNQISDIEPLVNNPGMGSGDSLYLYGNPLSSTSMNTYIPTLEGRGVTVYWDSPTNHSPDQPSNISPANAATEVSVTPTLQASAFSDPDAQDTHAASQWQMRTSSGSYSAPLFDRTEVVSNLTQYTVMQLDGLDGYTTYYWRVRYQDEHLAWSSWSTETSFTTGSPAPLVTTLDASGVAARAARLNGSLISLGTASSGTVSFVWGTSSGSYPNETSVQAVMSVGYYEIWFYFDVGDLTPGTTYYYRAKAVGDGTSYGVEKSFTTLPATPLVTTGNASGITTNAARLNGNLTSLGTASSVAVTFAWGTSPGSYSSETASQTMTSTGAFYSDLGILAPGTTYYCKAKAAGDGTSYGAETSFTTATTPPVVATNDATRIATTSATLNGELISMGTAPTVTASFHCGTTPGGPYNLVAEIGEDRIGTFSVVMDGLTPGITYYYRACADGDGDRVYGNEVSFTTGRIPEVGSLDPVEGKRKQQLTVTITGANLDGATDVDFGSEITVDDFDVVSNTQVTVEITIAAKAAKGGRDVSVTTEWGTATKTDGFTVVGGGGGICSAGTPAAPGAPSEIMTTLALIVVLFGAVYWLVRKGMKNARGSVRA